MLLTNVTIKEIEAGFVYPKEALNSLKMRFIIYNTDTIWLVGDTWKTEETKPAAIPFAFKFQWERMRAALIALLLITPCAALAQSEPKLIEGSVPVLGITPQLKPEADEATKIWALKRALIINGNSMVRWSSLDLTSEAASAKAIKTERIALPPVPKNKPSDEPAMTPEEEKRAHAVEAIVLLSYPPKDVCARHGFRRVDIEGGKSWRCRK